MSYISSHALAGLRNYEYKGVDRCIPLLRVIHSVVPIAESSTLRSFISNHVLNPFWGWFVTLWPEWVAPNMVRNSITVAYCTRLGLADNTVRLGNCAAQFCDVGIS